MKNYFLAAVFMPALFAQTPNAVVDHLLDRIVEREKTFLDLAKKRTPVIETYIQEVPESGLADAHPQKDHYFLGRLRMGETLGYETLIERTDAPPPKSPSWLPFHSSGKNRAMTFLPRGCASAWRRLQGRSARSRRRRLC